MKYFTKLKKKGISCGVFFSVPIDISKTADLRTCHVEEPFTAYLQNDYKQSRMLLPIPFAQLCCFRKSITDRCIRSLFTQPTLLKS